MKSLDKYFNVKKNCNTFKYREMGGSVSIFSNHNISSEYLMLLSNDTLATVSLSLVL
jgi:hypothetical protein